MEICYEATPPDALVKLAILIIRSQDATSLISKRYRNATTPDVNADRVNRCLDVIWKQNDVQ